jgi:hypothetical protein
MTKFKENVGSVLNGTGASTATSPSARESVALVLPPADDQQGIESAIGEASSTTTTTTLPATSPSASEAVALVLPPADDQQGIESAIGEASSTTTTTTLPATTPSASETAALLLPPADDQQGIENAIGEASSTTTTTTTTLPATSPSASEAVALLLPPADDQQGIESATGEASSTTTITTTTLADTAVVHGHLHVDVAIPDPYIHQRNDTVNAGDLAVMNATFEFGGHLPDHDVFMEQQQGADESADVRNHTPPRNRGDVPSFTSPSAWNLQLDPFSPTIQQDFEDACSDDDGPYEIVSYTRRCFSCRDWMCRINVI